MKTTTPTRIKPPPTDIYVKQVCGAYVSNTVQGRRSSCTHSAQACAELQASKLFGDQVQSVDEVNEGNTFTRLFRVTLKAAVSAQQG